MRDDERVFEVLAHASGPLTHVEIARRVDMTPTDAGRAAASLVVANRVSVTADRRYRVIDDD